jgi:hypothetical protein
MTRLEMSEQEKTTLVEVLESTLSELVTETAATDNRELRAALKARKSVIRGMLERLGENVA